MAELTDLSVEFIGEWNHPHGQQMLAFSMRIENGTGGLPLGYVPVDVGHSLLSVGISARLPGKRLLVAAPDRGPGLEQSA